MSLVIHLHLKAPAHDHSFGTRACRVRCAWIGARAWAGGGAHVAALEGSRVAVYESAVCIVLSGNICIVHEMPARLPGCSVGESTDSRELESRPEMQGPADAHGFARPLPAHVCRLGSRERDDWKAEADRAQQEARKVKDRVDAMAYKVNGLAAGAL